MPARHRPVLDATARAAATRSSPRGRRRARCTTGRHDAVPSPPRSAETSWPLIDLPREESRCLLQDLALLTQARVVAPQSAQLLPLISGQPLALARVDLRLAEPVTQRLRRDAELPSDLRQCQAARARIRRSCLRHLDSFLRRVAASIEVSTETGQPQPQS